MTRRTEVKPGDRYGRLTVIEEVQRKISPTNGRPYRQIRCKCKCGAWVVIGLEHARQGDSASCGCSRTKHGMTKSPMHMVWIGMRQRCFNKRYWAYSYYGGRGITVCTRWDSFEAFLEDIGERPDGGTLERIDNNGNYEPINCRWATRREQVCNRRNNHLLTHKGITQCLADWALEIGINASTIHSRLRAGWTVDAALEEPLRQGVRPDRVDATGGS